jgi:arylsulfatase A-like enzyme
VDDPLLVGRGKTTTYESGINIPFIVAGARVGTHARGTESSALVHAVDLFATVAEIAGVEPPPTDSVSFLPLLSEPSGLSVRSFNYSEFFRPNGPPPYRLHAQVVRESRYKLHRLYCVDIELYDLAKDPDERDNLLNGRELAEPERSALDRLHAELDAMVECRSDRDSDGVLDIVDNCRKAKNSDPLDSDKDGTGDACDSR